MTIRLLISDHDTIMREGLKRILEEQEDLVVVDEAADGYETLVKIRNDGIDLVISALSMPGPHGIELIRQIKRAVPKLPVLILTMHDEKQFAVSAIAAGAHGYVKKDSSSTELVHAIRQIASGRPYISIKVAELLMHSVMPVTGIMPHERLSQREFEIFTMFASGESNSTIAIRLSLSVKTISAHKKNIMKKMCLESVSEMAEYALNEKLIEPQLNTRS